MIDVFAYLFQYQKTKAKKLIYQALLAVPKSKRLHLFSRSPTFAKVGDLPASDLFYYLTICWDCMSHRTGSPDQSPGRSLYTQETQLFFLNGYKIIAN